MSAATMAPVPRNPHVPKLIRFPPAVYALLKMMAADDDRSETNFLVRLVREEAARRGLSAPEDRERP